VARLCECGCRTRLTGWRRRTKRFVDDSHRQRAGRERRARDAASQALEPPAEPVRNPWDPDFDFMWRSWPEGGGE
jgi:hypothetical protein